MSQNHKTYPLRGDMFFSCSVDLGDGRISQPTRPVVFNTFEKIFDCLEKVYGLLHAAVEILPDLEGQRETIRLVNRITSLLEDFPEMARRVGYQELADSIPSFAIDEGFVREFFKLESFADRKRKLNDQPGCKGYQHLVIGKLETPPTGLEFLNWALGEHRNFAAEAFYKAKKIEAIAENDSESTESHNPPIGGDCNWQSNSTKGWAIDLGVTERTITNWFNKDKSHEYIRKIDHGLYSIDTRHPFIRSEGWKKVNGSKPEASRKSVSEL